MSFAPARKSQTAQNRSGLRTQSGARSRKPSLGAPPGKGVRRSDPLANALVNYTASNARSRGGAGGLMDSQPNRPAGPSSEPFGFLNGPQGQRNGDRRDSNMNPHQQQQQNGPRPTDADSPPHFFYQGGEFVNSAAPPPPPNRRSGSMGPPDQQGTARLTRAQQLRQAYNESRYDNTRPNSSSPPAGSNAPRDTTPPLPPNQVRRPSNREGNGQDPPQLASFTPTHVQNYASRIRNRNQPNQEYNGNGAANENATLRADWGAGKKRADPQSAVQSNPAEQHANAALAEVKNPYIRSVLQGQETRWVPPSLAAEQQNPRTRSQSLTQYSSYHQHRELAPYLSRQHLFESWKENMRAGSQLPHRESSRDGSRTQQGRRLSGSSQHSPNPQDAGDIVDNTEWDVPDRDGGDGDRRGRRSVSESTAAQHPSMSAFVESQHRIFPLTNPHLTQKQEESLRDGRGRAGGRGRDADQDDDEPARRPQRRSAHSGSRRRRSSRRRGSKRRGKTNKSNSHDGERPRHNQDTKRRGTNGRHRHTWESSQSQSDRSDRHSRGSWTISDSSSSSVSSYDRHGSRGAGDRGPRVRSIGDALRNQQRGIAAQRRRQQTSRSRERNEKTRSRTPERKKGPSEDRRAYLYSPERKSAPRRRGAGDTHTQEDESDQSNSDHERAVYPPHHHSSQLFGGMNGGYTTTPLFNNEFNRSRSSHSPAARPPKEAGLIVSPNKPNVSGVTGSLLAVERLPRQFYFTQPEPMVQPNSGMPAQVVVTAPNHMDIRKMREKERGRELAQRESRTQARIHATPPSSVEDDLSSDYAEEPRIENALLSRGTVLVTTKRLPNDARKLDRSVSSQRNGRKADSDEESLTERDERKKKKHHKKREHSKKKQTVSEPHKRYNDKLAMFFGTIDQPSDFSPLKETNGEAAEKARAVARRLQQQPFEDEYMHDIDSHNDALAAVNAAPIVSYAFSNSGPVQPTPITSAGAPSIPYARYHGYAQPAHAEPSAVSFTSPTPLDYPSAESHAQAQATFWRRKGLIANSSQVNQSGTSDAPPRAVVQTRDPSPSASSISTNAGSSQSQQMQHRQQQQPSMLDKVWSRRQGTTTGAAPASNGSKQQDIRSARSQTDDEPEELTFTCPHCRASHQSGASCTNCGKPVGVPQPCGRCGVVGKGVFCSHCGSKKTLL